MSSGGELKSSGIKPCRVKVRRLKEKIIDNPAIGKPLGYELTGLLM